MGSGVSSYANSKQLCRHELLARHGAKRREHALVRDVASGELQVDHARALLGQAHDSPSFSRIAEQNIPAVVALSSVLSHRNPTEAQRRVSGAIDASSTAVRRIAHGRPTTHAS